MCARVWCACVCVCVCVQYLKTPFKKVHNGYGQRDVTMHSLN